MTFTGLLVHDITIVIPGSYTDRYGNPQKDWGAATGIATKGWVSMSSSNEDRADGREAQISAWVLYLDPTATIAGGDRVTWDGITFEVDGPPNHAWTPRGEHHIEAALRVVDG